jgi:hypothetical protein
LYIASVYIVYRLNRLQGNTMIQKEISDKGNPQRGKAQQSLVKRVGAFSWGKVRCPFPAWVLR